MTARTGDVPRVALSINEAAEAVGYSDKVIRQAIATGDLIARYGTGSKPVIPPRRPRRLAARRTHVTPAGFMNWGRGVAVPSSLPDSRTAMTGLRPRAGSCAPAPT